MWFACFALKRRVRWLWKARIPQDKNCWREIFCFQFHIGVLFRIQIYKHMMKTWKENEWLHLKTKASLFLNGMDAHHVDDAGMLDHVTAQAIPIWLWIPHWHGMCASFGWEPAPFFDPFRSVPFQEAEHGWSKEKPVTQESFPTHLPPPRICPKICFGWLPWLLVVY